MGRGKRTAILEAESPEAGRQGAEPGQAVSSMAGWAGGSAEWGGPRERAGKRGFAAPEVGEAARATDPSATGAAFPATRVATAPTERRRSHLPAVPVAILAPVFVPALAALSLAAPAAASAAILAAPLPAATQELRLAPGDGAWEVAGDVAPGRVEGRDALRLRIGEAHRPDVELADGTLEFDMRVTDRRTFVGVKLRLREDGTYEDVYFRPHKSGLPDAVQYNPSWRGVGQWQLHHGPDATAFADYRPGEWQHVRIELRGSRAAIFLGDDPEPRLVVPHLRTGLGRGAVGFWANQPGAGSDDPWTVALSDIRVRPGVTSWAFPPDPDEPPVGGAIRRWEVSRPSRGDAAALDTLPEAARRGPWRVVEAAPSGLLSLDRWLHRPAEGPALVFARIRLRAHRAVHARLDLGWSDDVTVFLDGRAVFSGHFGYSYNFPRRDGLVTPDQATVHMPLEPGPHEVVVAVSDVFGGWGLVGRILDRRGLEVIPP